MRVLILLLLLASQGQAASHFVWATVTAYCPCTKCCGPGAQGLTSTGLACKDHPRGIAVDPKCIPYGTRIAVPGYGIARADDTGGAMRKDWKCGVVHIDVRFADHTAAKSFGVKHMYIEVEDP